MKNKKIMHIEPDLSIYSDDTFTVTNFSIQIAIYMGFKEIYLLGCDCDYIKQLHFHGNDTIIPQSNEYLYNIQKHQMKGYKAIKDFAEQKNVMIINSTNGGRLEVFDRVKLDDVLNKPNNN